MILFFDENIPRKVADSIRPLAECQVLHLLERLDAGTSDEDVFKYVAQIGAVLVTQDARIRRRPHQLEALKQAGVGCFIVSGRAQRSVEELAVLLIRALADIRSTVASVRKPYVYAINDRSKIERLI